MDAISTIGLEEYMNCVLVQADVRPAFLIQTADYMKYSIPYIQRLIELKQEGITHYFPELRVSPVGKKQNDLFDGYLVSKRLYTGEEITSDEQMGAILGYPCAAEYEYVTTHKDESSVGIQLLVTLKSGDDIQLMAYVCKDDRTFASATDLAVRMEETLLKDPLLTPMIKSVTAEKQIVVPIKAILARLIGGQPLTGDEEYELRNQIGNIGFEDESLFNYAYQYNNPVHRGILISLMVYLDNDIMDPFYPLQHHEEHADVQTKINVWGKELARVLDATRAVEGGRRRKNRKTRRHS